MFVHSHIQRSRRQAAAPPPPVQSAADTTTTTTIPSSSHSQHNNNQATRGGGHSTKVANLHRASSKPTGHHKNNQAQPESAASRHRRRRDRHQHQAGQTIRSNSGPSDSRSPKCAVGGAGRFVEQATRAPALFVSSTQQTSLAHVNHQSTTTSTDYGYNNISFLKPTRPTSINESSSCCASAELAGGEISREQAGGISCSRSFTDFGGAQRRWRLWPRVVCAGCLTNSNDGGGSSFADTSEQQSSPQMNCITAPDSNQSDETNRGQRVSLAHQQHDDDDYEQSRPPLVRATIRSNDNAITKKTTTTTQTTTTETTISAKQANEREEEEEEAELTPRVDQICASEWPKCAPHWPLYRDASQERHRSESSSPVDDNYCDDDEDHEQDETREALNNCDDDDGEDEDEDDDSARNLHQRLQRTNSDYSAIESIGFMLGAVDYLFDCLFALVDVIDNNQSSVGRKARKFEHYSANAKLIGSFLADFIKYQVDTWRPLIELSLAIDHRRVPRQPLDSCSSREHQLATKAAHQLKLCRQFSFSMSPPPPSDGRALTSKRSRKHELAYGPKSMGHQQHHHQQVYVMRYEPQARAKARMGQNSGDDPRLRSITSHRQQPDMQPVATAPRQHHHHHQQQPSWPCGQAQLDEASTTIGKQYRGYELAIERPHRVPHANHNHNHNAASSSSSTQWVERAQLDGGGANPAPPVQDPMAAETIRHQQVQLAHCQQIEGSGGGRLYSRSRCYGTAAEPGPRWRQDESVERARYCRAKQQASTSSQGHTASSPTLVDDLRVAELMMCNSDTNLDTNNTNAQHTSQRWNAAGLAHRKSAQAHNHYHSSQLAPPMVSGATIDHGELERSGAETMHRFYGGGGGSTPSATNDASAGRYRRDLAGARPGCWPPFVVTPQRDARFSASYCDGGGGGGGGRGSGSHSNPQAGQGAVETAALAYSASLDWHPPADRLTRQSESVERDKQLSHARAASECDPGDIGAVKAARKPKTNQQLQKTTSTGAVNHRPSGGSCGARHNHRAAAPSRRPVASCAGCMAPPAQEGQVSRSPTASQSSSVVSSRASCNFVAAATVAATSPGHRSVVETATVASAAAHPTSSTSSSSSSPSVGENNDKSKQPPPMLANHKKKANSASPLGRVVSLAGAKKRLGFKHKDGLSSLSVHRSEEILPAERNNSSRMLLSAYLQTAAAATTQANSLNESSFDDSSSSTTHWSSSAAYQGQAQYNHTHASHLYGGLLAHHYQHQLQLAQQQQQQQQQQQPAPMDPNVCFVEGLGVGQIASRQALVSPYLGDVQLSLTDQRGFLEVEVIRVRQLQAKPFAMRIPAVYVKVYLMKRKKCVAKFKTNLVKNSLDPLFQQRFAFRDSYSDCVLQVIVWGDYGKKDRKSLMGLVQIHLNDLEMSNVVIGWYKLFNAPSLASITSLANSSKSLRQTVSSAKLGVDDITQQQQQAVDLDASPVNK